MPLIPPHSLTIVKISNTLKYKKISVWKIQIIPIKQWKQYKNQQCGWTNIIAIKEKKQ